MALSTVSAFHHGSRIRHGLSSLYLALTDAESASGLLRGISVLAPVIAACPCPGCRAAPNGRIAVRHSHARQGEREQSLQDLPRPFARPSCPGKAEAHREAADQAARKRRRI